MNINKFTPGVFFNHVKVTKSKMHTFKLIANTFNFVNAYESSFCSDSNMIKNVFTYTIQ